MVTSIDPRLSLSNWHPMRYECTVINNTNENQWWKVTFLRTPGWYMFHSVRISFMELPCMKFCTMSVSNKNRSPSPHLMNYGLKN